MAPSVPLQDAPVMEIVDIIKRFPDVSYKYRGVPSLFDMLPDREQANKLILAAANPTYVASREELIINVRGDETLGDCHRDYGPVPISFFRTVIEKTNLNPVFLGQLGHDYYSTVLRAEFPHAKFVPSGGAYNDFEAIRSAHHIIPAVSTFSWLASWLSSAETVHLPLLGMLNPRQRRDTWLLPLGDPRYRYYQFPVRYWQATKQQKEDVLFRYGLPKPISVSVLENLQKENYSIRRPLQVRALKKFEQQSAVASRLGFISCVKIKI